MSAKPPPWNDHAFIFQENGARKKEYSSTGRASHPKRPPPGRSLPQTPPDHHPPVSGHARLFLSRHHAAHSTIYLPSNNPSPSLSNNSNHMYRHCHNLNHTFSSSSEARVRRKRNERRGNEPPQIMRRRLIVAASVRKRLEECSTGAMRATLRIYRGAQRKKNDSQLGKSGFDYFFLPSPCPRSTGVGGENHRLKEDHHDNH